MGHVWILQSLLGDPSTQTLPYIILGTLIGSSFPLEAYYQTSWIFVIIDIANQLIYRLNESHHSRCTIAFDSKPIIWLILSWMLSDRLSLSVRGVRRENRKSLTLLLISRFTDCICRKFLGVARPPCVYFSRSLLTSYEVGAQSESVCRGCVHRETTTKLPSKFVSYCSLATWHNRCLGSPLITWPSLLHHRCMSFLQDTKL